MVFLSGTQRGRWEPTVGQWTFERLSFLERELELAEPLIVRIGRNGKQWFADNRELGICVSATSIGRLLEQVAETFFTLWDRYVAGDNDEVTAEGVAIRDALQRMAGYKQKTF